ncbi:MAG: S26 family signal peptidase [Candidatus Poseidoniia archaeon]|mgnify:FL=1|jgi:signal peptidase|nr:S26 family signal peptidase [Candidatus Poseidoniia archaeon]MDP7082365.1 S26 family signal peptidase [Candidatus Poseidoniia archaeon]MDP7256173.1 S26 family signal peptidase [Candidatus Poseidoniia archaeon]MDP7474090.1 S26 family signal peptidase [Candidatus Poseidoniia archaeon]MDP7538249.1 S26 family signal peptidase [Candidatus Poseidoniia archaeon]|tara:strand:+ start:2736 stop:3611 length:876 start_codon:yes stop_codon:yes gene_type:complete
MDFKALKQLPPWARELLSAFAVVLVVFLLAWGYTGNWPPMVVIESGSMEHDSNQLYPEPGFTHIGPIDTGDLVLVKSAERDDIVTYLEGKQTGYKRYGDYGDVIIYYKNGVLGGCDMNMTSRFDFDISITTEAECNQQDGEWIVATPVIHRAMAWVEVRDDGSYYLPEIDMEFSNGKLVLAEIGLPPDAPLTGLDHSGYITKGDSTGNRHPDQLTHRDLYGQDVQPVQPEDIIGMARGELPWFGLIKLRLTQPASYASAPEECRQMLWLSLATIIIGPFVAQRVWERRREG